MSEKKNKKKKSNFWFWFLCFNDLLFFFLLPKGFSKSASNFMTKNAHFIPSITQKQNKIKSGISFFFAFFHYDDEKRRIYFKFFAVLISLSRFTEFYLNSKLTFSFFFFGFCLCKRNDGPKKWTDTYQKRFSPTFIMCNKA